MAGSKVCCRHILVLKMTGMGQLGDGRDGVFNNARCVCRGTGTYGVKCQEHKEKMGVVAYR